MLNKKVGFTAVLACLSASELFAGNFTSYSVGDVLLCFRTSVGANDLVVDLGPVSTLTNATPNQRIPITQYTGNQLGVLGMTNNLIWSAFTYYNTSVPSSMQWTLFASKPRTSLNSQTAPIVTYTASAQHQAANGMAAIPLGAYDCFVTTNYNALSTATAVLEPNDPSNVNPIYKTGQSYIGALGSNLNFDGAYQGFPENTTPANFTTAGTVQRSDFYWLPPGNNITTHGVFLGYFELNTNGVMTYVAYPTATPTVPVIQSITRTNNITSVSFTTGPSGTYTLLGSSTLTGPLSSWTAITSASGNGSVVTLQDTTSGSLKFYTISAQ